MNSGGRGAHGSTRSHSTRRARRRPAFRRALIGLASLVCLLGLPARGVARSSALPLEAPARRVVLLHGLGRSARDLALLARRLDGLGHSVCNVDYDSRADSIEIVAAEVTRAIDACGFGSGPVDYVTHSMGSLVLRALSRDGRVAQGGRAVLLAPPSAGSELADRLGEGPWLELLLGPLAGQLGTGSGDLPGSLPPPAIPFGVVAGDRAWNPLGWLWLPGPHDGTVTVARTRLAGMSDHIVLPYTHTFMAWAPSVARQVDVFLRTGRFERGGPPD